MTNAVKGKMPLERGREQEIHDILREYRENVFCKWAVILEITTVEILEASLLEFGEMERAGKRTTLREFFNSVGIKKKQMGLLLAVKAYLEQLEKDKKFGNIAISNGFVSPEVVKSTLAIQMADFKKHKKSTKLGDMLVERGEMTEEQRDLVLVVQKRKDPGIENVVRTVRKNEAETEKKLDHLLSLSLSHDKLIAYIGTQAPIPPEIKETEINNWLFNKNIKFGIYNAKITEFLRENTPGKMYKIAESQYPVPGKDASVVYHFDTGFVRLNGSKSDDAGENPGERRKIPSVKVGDLLGEKIPREVGKPGINLHGKKIEPDPALDIHLWSGNGVYSPDRLRFYAEISGLPRLSRKNTITVEPEFQVVGDVDASTGNISFDNDVHITGTVRDGIRIRCNNLKAREILDAEIQATGNVDVIKMIRDAVISATFDSTLSAESPSEESHEYGNINAKSIKNTRITAFGNLRAEKEIVDSQIVLSGVCKVRSKGYTIEGRIVGSRVSAMYGINAVDIGSPGTSPSELNVGMDVNIQEKKKELSKELDITVKLRNQLTRNMEGYNDDLKETLEKISQMEQVLENSKQDQDTLKRSIADFTRRGDKERRAHAEEQLSEIDSKAAAAKDALGNYHDLKDRFKAKIAKLGDQIRRVTVDMERIDARSLENLQVREGVAVVEVTGTIWKDTVVNGIHSSITLDRNHRNVRIKEELVTPGKWEMRIHKLS